mmetsp:Transcript_13471/g.31679  ORF Transcript_13471/g.31679 Transcript_13471/m.31679 type:complete len:90 (-) Transcript_13471:433-702(-)
MRHLVLALCQNVMRDPLLAGRGTEKRETEAAEEAMRPIAASERAGIAPMVAAGGLQAESEGVRFMPLQTGDARRGVKKGLGLGLDLGPN